MALTGNKIEFNGLELESSKALVLLFTIGVFCFVCRTLSFFGTQIYIEKIKELHQMVYPKAKQKRLQDIWSFTPLSTYTLYFTVQFSGGAGLILKPIIGLGFVSPAVFSLYSIVKAGYVQSLVQYEPISVIFFLSWMLLFSSFLLENYIVNKGFGKSAKESLDSMSW